MPGCRAGPSWRVVSPSGGSILMTSAPRSPNCCAAQGPSTTVVQSRIRTPLSGPAIASPPFSGGHLSRLPTGRETRQQPGAKFPAAVTFAGRPVDRPARYSTHGQGGCHVWYLAEASGTYCGGTRRRHYRHDDGWHGGRGPQRWLLGSPLL